MFSLILPQNEVLLPMYEVHLPLYEVPSPQYNVVTRNLLSCFVQSIVLLVFVYDEPKLQLSHAERLSIFHQGMDFSTL